MIWSIRTRLIICCVLLVMLTGTSLMWFAHQDTIVTLRGTERRSLNNVLYVLEQSLAAAHVESVRSKVTAVEEIKERIRRAGAEVYAGLEPLILRSAGGRAGSEPELSRLLRGWRANPAARELEFSLFLGSARSMAAEALPPGPLLPENLVNAEGGERAEPLPEFARPALAGLPQSGDAVFFTDLKNDISHLYYLARFDKAVLLCRADLAGVEVRAEQARLGAAARFDALLEQVQIQKTGFAAALDNRGRVVAGPRDAHIPPKLRQSIRLGEYAGAARRVMVLGAEDIEVPPAQSEGGGIDSPRPGAAGGDMLYLLGYFRPLDWNLVVAAPLDELEGRVLGLVYRQLMLTLLIILGGILVGLVLGTRISGPIRRLSAVARALPEQDILDLDTAALEKSLPTKRRDEVGDLARSFGFMAEELSSNVRALLQAQAERERLDRELEVAHDIQNGILPQPLEDTVPEGSARTGPRFELASGMITAKEVGGDLYDFFLVNERELFFVIGDVSDKSVPAALFMSMAVTTIRAAMHDGRAAPNEALGQVNNLLASHNSRNMFVTLCIGKLDLGSGRLAWASAGHMPPVLLRRNSGGAWAAEHLEASELERSEEMVAGVFEDVDYTLFSRSLAPGEGIFLYTDGVSEALNEAGELFGSERLLAALSNAGSTEPAVVTRHIFDTVKQYAGEAEQSDDIAILALRYLGPAVH